MWFKTGRNYQTISDTFTVPDFPPRWTVVDGELVGNEIVRKLPLRTPLLCLGSNGDKVPTTDSKGNPLEYGPEEYCHFVWFEDVAAGRVYRYQLSLRAGGLGCWEELPEK